MELSPDHDPITLALSNHLIISQIIAHLPQKDLKSARLLSRKWSELTTPLLGLSSVIYPLALGFPPLLLALLTNVHLQLEGDANPTGFLSTNHTHLQQIVFSTKTSPVVNSIFILLRDLAFPVLNKIKIHISDVIWSDPPFRPFTFPSRPCLTSVSIVIGERSKVMNVTFQNLINSCPSLTKLRIDGHFYPDLNGCLTLTWLSLQGTRDLDSFPILPGLKSLKISGSYSPWNFINDSNLPNLAHLELLGLESEQIPRFQGISGNVTSLTIGAGKFNKISAPEMVTRFGVVFPNVTVFETCFLVDNDGTDAIFEAILQKQVWTLDKVVTHVRRLSWHQVLGCLLLWNVHGKSWKKFQLINGDPFVKMEDFGLDPDHIKRFLELILPSKGMEEGLIFDRILRDFNGNTNSAEWDGVSNFIADNGLRVKFY